MIKTMKAASIALFTTAIIAFGMIAKAQSQQNYFRYTIDGQFGTGPKTGGPQMPPSQNNLSVSVAPATSSIFVGQAYAAVATATNASAGAVFGIVNASAPIANFGLGIDAATGSVTGTLTTSGTLTFQVRATDGDRTATSNVVSITAVQPVVTYNRSTYQIGSAFNSGPPATNIPNPIFSLEPSAPPWAGIDSQTGIVVGTPSGVTAGQTLTFPIRATSGTISAAASWSVDVIAPTIHVNGVPQALAVGQSTSMTTTTSLIGSLVYSLNNAPAWLSIDPNTGHISGTAVSQEPAENFTVTASNGTVQVTSPPYSIAIAAPLTLAYARAQYAPTTQSNFTTGQPAVNGAVAAKTFSVQTGSLPPGLSLDASTGAITGVTTASGSTSVTVRVTDGYGAATQALSFNTQAVVAGNVCFTGGLYDTAGDYTIPHYNRLTIYLVGGGGGGGNGRIEQYDDKRDGLSGGASTASLKPEITGPVVGGGGGGGGGSGGGGGGAFTGFNLWAPGGFGGEATTLAGIGAQRPGVPPQAGDPSGQLAWSVAGAAGSAGFKTMETAIQPSWGLGGATTRHGVNGPRFNFAQFEWNNVTGSADPTGPGVGGSGVCISPDPANRPNYQGFNWWCGAGGTAGGEIQYIIDRSLHPNAPEPGRVYQYVAGRFGTANASNAGAGGPGQVCFTVE